MMLVGGGPSARRLAARLATRIRQLSLQRIPYGSDAAIWGNLPAKEGWEAFRSLPLPDNEFRTIAGNVPPYFPHLSRRVAIDRLVLTCHPDTVCSDRAGRQP
jgi:hypothetical protein